MGLSDDETVLTITENPYLQYFIGLHEFQEKAPFDPSLMTHFRKRFDADFINQLNEQIVKKQQEKSSDKRSKNDPPDQDGGTPPSSGGDSLETTEQEDHKETHQGKLLLDATCASADVAYPTDIGLLNTAREKLEKMIDTLHAPFIGKRRKPRTYRDIARKQYLSLSKQRKPGKEKIH